MKWSLHRKKAIEVIDKDVALAKHNKGIGYTVVLSEMGIITNVIEVEKEGVVVRFMNEDIETYLLYGFQRCGETDIFLNMVYYYNYQNSQEIENIFFNFKENGEMAIERRNLITGELEEKEAIVDVSCNWERFPEFGDYLKLVLLHRKLY